MQRYVFSIIGCNNDIFFNKIGGNIMRGREKIAISF